MRRKCFAAVLFAALGSSGPATAQSADQTPGNAHRFLTTLASQNAITFSPKEHYEDQKIYGVRNGKIYLRDHKALNYRPLTLIIAESSGCLTKLRNGPLPRAYERKPDQDSIGYIESRRSFVPYLQSMAENGLNWSKILSVTATGSTVIVDSTDKSHIIWLHFQSAAMATRAAYALEVIRQSCDPVADTGF